MTKMPGASQTLCFVLAVSAMLLFPGIALPGASLDAMLTPYLSKYELPSVAAAVTKSGRIVACGAVGTRRAGEVIPVTIHDRMHIGSCTKAFTALLAGMMVDEQKLRWDSTIGEVLHDMAGTMDPKVRDVTLQQLLSHSGGLPSDNDEVETLYMQAMLMDSPSDLEKMRCWLVQEATKMPLKADPGTTYSYSNLGFVIAAAMIEHVEGKSWEELITSRIFAPLRLASAGLGPQSSPGKVDAPLPHTFVDGKPKGLLNCPNADVPTVIGPAGNGHLSVQDFARWAAWQAGEGRRSPGLVRPETLVKLHTPVIDMTPKIPPPPGTIPGNKYCMAWVQGSVTWAPYPLLYHGGTNMKNYALIWLDTRQDLAIVVLTNIGGLKAEQALFLISGELYKGNWR